MAHTAIGPHDRMILDAIKEFAAAGYVAFALDMYGAPKTVTGARLRHNRSLARCIALSRILTDVYQQSTISRSLVDV